MAARSPQPAHPLTLNHRTLPARLTTASPAGPEPSRVVLLHGFTQNLDCWGPFAELLAETHEVVLIDAPGHGAANHPDHDSSDLWESARLIGEVGGRAHYVGYSMGGRMALHLALSHPELVRSLTLIGATAGIDAEEDRATRRNADDALAQRLLDEGLEAFLERWLANPLFAHLDQEAAALRARLTNRPEGLAASLRNVGTGSQEPLWSRLCEIEVSALVVVGDQDVKFTQLGMRLIEELPNAAMASAPGGHPIQSEQPDAVAATIRRFLSTV